MVVKNERLKEKVCRRMGFLLKKPRGENNHSEGANEGYWPNRKESPSAKYGKKRIETKLKKRETLALMWMEGLNRKSRLVLAR